MLKFFDNPFSPFARKVRLALAHKKLEWTTVDGLALDNLAGLEKINPRAEVPAVVDGDVIVINSADILAYLEHRYPENPIFPIDAAKRVRARAWERLADTAFDAILHDISLWQWPTHQRSDQPPEGLIAAGHEDLRKILSQLDADLAGSEYVAGEISIADFALFPHVSGLKPVGFDLQAGDFSHVSAWYNRMRKLEYVKADINHTKRSALALFRGKDKRYEDTKVIWRSDRIEWLLSRGFHDWFLSEIRAGRAVIPKSVR